jgi:hypothetical protein
MEAYVNGVSTRKVDLAGPRLSVHRE